MEGEGVKLAFCPVLWKSNGGPMDPQGHPVISPREEDNVRGYCTKGFDCALCPLLQNELSYVAPENKLWVCSDCVKDLMRLGKELQTKLITPGYYSEGFCQSPTCSRPNRTEPGEELQARHSILLQLLIGPAVFLAVDLHGK